MYILWLRSSVPKPLKLLAVAAAVPNAIHRMFLVVSHAFAWYWWPSPGASGVPITPKAVPQFGVPFVVVQEGVASGPDCGNVKCLLSTRFTRTGPPLKLG